MPLPGLAIGSLYVTPGATGAESQLPLITPPHFASAPFSSFCRQQLFNVDSRKKKRKAVRFTLAPKRLQIISAYLSNFNDDKVALLSRGQVQSRKSVPCSATSLSCPESRRQNVEAVCGGYLTHYLINLVHLCLFCVRGLITQLPSFARLSAPFPPLPAKILMKWMLIRSNN